MTRSRPFPAKYSSECSWCGEFLEEGEEAVFQDDVIMHEDCANDSSPADDPRFKRSSNRLRTWGSHGRSR